MTAEAGARAAREHHARDVRRVPALGLIFNYEPIDRVFNRLGVTVFGANCLVGGKKIPVWDEFSARGLCVSQGKTFRFGFSKDASFIAWAKPWAYTSALIWAAPR